MICKITIRMDNAAFHDPEDGETPSAYGMGMELAFILNMLAKRVHDGCEAGDHYGAFDGNGNRVGQLVIEED